MVFKSNKISINRVFTVPGFHFMTGPGLCRLSSSPGQCMYDDNNHLKAFAVTIILTPEWVK